MKEMLWLVVAILIIFLVVLFFPTGTNDYQNPSEQASTPTVPEGSKVEQAARANDAPTAMEEETRYRLMQAEFAKLEKGRRDLKRRLGKLRYHLKDIQLPATQAQQVNEVMLNGYKLLHTPKMLGAFSDVAGIAEELGRVNYAHANLDEVDRILQQNRPVEETATGGQQ